MYPASKNLNNGKQRIVFFLNFNPVCQSQLELYRGFAQRHNSTILILPYGCVVRTIIKQTLMFVNILFSCKLNEHNTCDILENKLV